MVVVYGTGLYGRVDTVPGAFSVATKFFHIFWVPLLPLGSHIVVDETDDGWQGVPIELCGRSVLAAYLRGGLIGGGIWSIILSIAIYCSGETGSEDTVMAGNFFWVGAGAIPLGLMALLLWRTPTEQRVREICAELHVDPDEAFQFDEAPCGTEEMGPMLSDGPGTRSAPNTPNEMRTPEETRNPYARKSPL
jgi:hypothetical protein